MFTTTLRSLLLFRGDQFLLGEETEVHGVNHQPSVEKLINLNNSDEVERTCHV